MAEIRSVVVGGGGGGNRGRGLALSRFGLDQDRFGGWDRDGRGGERGSRATGGGRGRGGKEVGDRVEVAAVTRRGRGRRSTMGGDRRRRGKRELERQRRWG